jgi:hypothetical protein
MTCEPDGAYWPPTGPDRRPRAVQAADGHGKPGVDFQVSTH